MKRLFIIAAALTVIPSLAGCTLITDVDRTKIATESLPTPDAGADEMGDSSAPAADAGDEGSDDASSSPPESDAGDEGGDASTTSDSGSGAETGAPEDDGGTTEVDAGDAG